MIHISDISQHVSRQLMFFKVFMKMYVLSSDSEILHLTFPNRFVEFRQFFGFVIFTKVYNFF